MVTPCRSSPSPTCRWLSGCRRPLVGIAKFGISAGSRGSITMRGVFDVVKDPTTNIPAGTILYWSEISWHVVKNAYAHPMMGKAIESAPPGTRCVRLRLSQ